MAPSAPANAVVRPKGGDVSHAGDQIRLISRVARLFHEQGMRQAEIAEMLHISQPRVSRLLKRAVELGIVRTTVTVPSGVHTDLEEQLEEKYALRAAVVVDDDGDTNYALGAAAAEYLSSTLIGGDTIGVSTWSASLMATVAAMRPFRNQVADSVVQLMGGVGDPRVQMQATRMISQLATDTHANPLILPTPGILATPEARASLMADPAVADAVECWSRLTVALLGIGTVEPSDLAEQSGNVFPEADRAELEAAGAVGDVCFRFFDAAGQIIQSQFNDRVIGIGHEQLLTVDRRIAVAGGSRKVAAIRAALRGGWVNVLVTDAPTAQRLLHQS